MKIHTLNTTKSYPAPNQNVTPSIKSNFKNINGQSPTVVPISYHRQMFETNQKLSNITFRSHLEESRMILLKKSLTKICENAINDYNRHNEAISKNLFTRSFIHHSLDFTEKEGHMFNNSKDPFHPEQWSAYFNTKNKTTVSGKTLATVYSENMNNRIDSWNQKFIQIITKEKNDGDNNLLDDLLDSSNNIEKIKKLLFID